MRCVVILWCVCVCRGENCVCYFDHFWSVLEIKFLFTFYLSIWFPLDFARREREKKTLSNMILGFKSFGWQNEKKIKKFLKSNLFKRHQNQTHQTFSPNKLFVENVCVFFLARKKNMNNRMKCRNDKNAKRCVSLVGGK